MISSVAKQLSPLDNKRWKLPQDWEWIALGRITQIIMGQSPPGKSYNTNGKGLPFFQGKAEFGEFYPTPVKWCTDPKKVAQPGDVLISVRAPVGPTNLAKEESCIGRGLAAIRSGPGLINRYLLYALRAFEVSLSQQSTGSTFGAIGKTVLSNFSIPVPFPNNEIRSLEIQHRILARIEALLTEIKNARKIIEEMSRDAEKIMEALLNDIFSEKKFADWQASTIDDLAYVKGGKRLPKGATFSPVPTKWPYLRVVDFKNGSVDQTDLRFLSDQVHKIISKYTISKDDVYISIAGTIGLVGIVPDKLDGANLTENAAKIVFKPLWKTKIDRKYLVFFLQSPFSRQQIGQRAFAAGQPKLALERIKTIPVYHPELIELQQRIVAYLDSLRKETEEIQASINRDSVLLGQLEQSILDRAFRGEI